MGWHSLLTSLSAFERVSKMKRAIKVFECKTQSVNIESHGENVLTPFFVVLPRTIFWRIFLKRRLYLKKYSRHTTHVLWFYHIFGDVATHKINVFTQKLFFNLIFFNELLNELYIFIFNYLNF